MVPFTLEASPDGVHGIINIPAIIILALLTALLIRGFESATVGSIIVITKVAIVLLVIGIAGNSSTPPITRRLFQLRPDTARRAWFILAA